MNNIYTKYVHQARKPPISHDRSRHETRHTNLDLSLRRHQDSTNIPRDRVLCWRAHISISQFHSVPTRRIDHFGVPQLRSQSLQTIRLHTYLCLSVGVRLLVMEYSRGIIASEGYDRVRRVRVV